MSQEVEAEGRSREFQQTHRLFAEMGATEMQVYADGEEAFTRLMQRVMDSTESVQVRVKGAVKVFVETVVGSLGVPTEVDLWQSVDGTRKHFLSLANAAPAARRAGLAFCA